MQRKNIAIKLPDETFTLHDANKNWRFYTPEFTWNFPVLIMITTQLLAAFRPFNLNNSDISDLDNYNFKNYRITRFFYKSQQFLAEPEMFFFMGQFWQS